MRGWRPWSEVGVRPGAAAGAGAAKAKVVMGEGVIGGVGLGAVERAAADAVMEATEEGAAGRQAYLRPPDAPLAPRHR